VISLQKHIKKVPSVIILILLGFHRSILTYIVFQNWLHINDKPEEGISLCPIQYCYSFLFMVISYYVGAFITCHLFPNTGAQRHTQQDGKRNQSMKIPLQSLSGS